jgi:hypothetical protein
MALVVPHPGQKTSSHGVPAISAARIVGEPQHVAAAGELVVPSLINGLRLSSSGSVGGVPHGTSLDVQPPGSNPHDSAPS